MFPADTRILIADDMTNQVLFVRMELKNLGFTGAMPGAPNGKVALEILEKQKAKQEPIGLIISDWEMPLMNGLEFLKNVRAHPDFKDIPVIMLTSHNNAEQVSAAAQAGASGYMTKPFSRASLRDKLQKTWDLLHPK